MKYVIKSMATRLPALLLLSTFAMTNASAEQVTIDSRDFIPIFGNSVYGESSAGNLVCVGGNAGKLFIAQVPLPPAPVELDIKQIAMWGGDFSSTDASVQLDRYCQTEFAASTPVRTDLTDISSSGSGGNYFDVPGNARCAVRLGLQGPGYSDSRDGFRICLGVPKVRPQKKEK